MRIKLESKNFIRKKKKIRIRKFFSNKVSLFESFFLFE